MRIRSVRNQTAINNNIESVGVDRGQLVLGRKLNDPTAMNRLSRTRRHNEPAIPGVDKDRDSAFDLVGVAHVNGADLDPQRPRQGLNGTELTDRCRIRGIANDGRSCQLRRQSP